MQREHPAVRRVLISVFDKTGLVPFAKGLAHVGAELLASGGTATALEEAGLKVRRIEVFTGAQEVLGGRVKTLHPKVHAGILADRREAGHMEELQKHGYEPIDMVVCNLYPFAEYLREGKERDAMIEKIDIGGPTLLRAAAKNVDGGVTVVSSPKSYADVLTALYENEGISSSMRRALAARTFRAVAEYDVLIAGWAEQQAAMVPENGLPQALEGFNHVRTLRYGENPHQKASLYRSLQELGIAAGTLVTGKELSYNNYLDMDAAYRTAHALSQPACAIIKHTNPCGLAQASSQAKAFERALSGDPLSAFGSVIGFNSKLELATVEAILKAKLFVECIAAPSFAEDAMEALRKKENLRLFAVPPGDPTPKYHAHRISGGLLVQESDTPDPDTSLWRVVTKKKVNDAMLEELDFAMRAATVLKSNAISVTRDHTLLGAGAGHMSRVDAAEQALKKSGDKARGAFLASDAFFPFGDCVELAALSGIAAIVQPGGSKRDQESIDACDKHGIAMVFTGRRHFRH